MSRTAMEWSKKYCNGMMEISGMDSDTTMECNGVQHNEYSKMSKRKTIQQWSAMSAMNSAMECNGVITTLIAQ